jgi:hypothetical protein
MADLTTEFVGHLVSLRGTASGAGVDLDVSTLVAKDVPVKRAAAAANVVQDLNTVYEVAL